MEVEEGSEEVINPDDIVQMALDGWGDMKYCSFETRATVQRCKEVNKQVQPSNTLVNTTPVSQ